MMKVALYARYSSDNQRDASIADQLRVCREFAQRQGWHIEREYADHAVSGATLLRPGIQALMRDALAQRFDIVFAESLDRFSRDQEDTAGLFKRLTFKGVHIVTLAEGDITHLHIGLKGTMNALFLKELAEKTHRGLRGRVEAGKSGGGLCYGYRVVRARDASLVTGELTIEPNEAQVVERIFRDYAAGTSPQAIAKRLNAEHVAGPGGRTWGPSTLHGHTKRGTGILNNELYLGRRVWNRLRYVKDPDTGKRVSRLNPQSEWIVSDVHELRIISEEAWTAVKARQQQMRQTVAAAGNIGRAQRPLHLFSGLIRCGVCGRSYVVCSVHGLACSGHRERGICTNALRIRRKEIEARVLGALQTRFFQSDRFQVFCDEFTAAVNEARMEQRASLSSAKRELEQVQREIRQVIEMMKRGIADENFDDVKSEMSAIKHCVDAAVAEKRNDLDNWASPQCV
jgi:site-specific DNA recombinase